MNTLIPDLMNQGVRPLLDRPRQQAAASEPSAEAVLLACADHLARLMDAAESPLRKTIVGRKYVAALEEAAAAARTAAELSEVALGLPSVQAVASAASRFRELVEVANARANSHQARLAKMHAWPPPEVEAKISAALAAHRANPEAAIDIATAFKDDI